MPWENPFHEGELKAQQMAGEAREGESNGAMIDNKIMSGALNFIRAQKMAIVSSRDAQGRRWASLLFGKEGFLDPSTDRRALAIALDPAENDADDPLWVNLESGAHIGVLIIELATRRRLRLNGAVARTKHLLTVAVEESFGNCPKYITRRELSIKPRKKPVRNGEALRGKSLGPAQTAMVAAADVLFLATGHPERGADASHRGGNPGFVEVLNANALRIPDYFGNSMFNTLGNLLVDSHYGLLIPDFHSGKVLQLTGAAKVTWSDDDSEQRTGDTKRFVDFHVDEWREARMAADVSEKVLDYSRYNP
jgi:predicted pyridoxine 5'-phosphate oxidase superfamily flavin-nucleotide-binding protein